MPYVVLQMPNKRTENKACFFNSDVDTKTAISICLTETSGTGGRGEGWEEGEKERERKRTKKEWVSGRERKGGKGRERRRRNGAGKIVSVLMRRVLKENRAGFKVKREKKCWCCAVIFIKRKMKKNQRSDTRIVIRRKSKILTNFYENIQIA